MFGIKIMQRITNIPAIFKPKHSVGDLVIFNESKTFGDKNDRLFHIHAIRYGTCTGMILKRYWYAGYLLTIGKFESKGLPRIPIFSTTITNASEDKLKTLDHLRIKFNPYK